MKTKKEIAKLLKENSNVGIRLDLGGGQAPQKGFVNIDIRCLPEVDIVHDLEKFPWPIPSESVQFCMASHIIEHFSKGRTDPKLIGLINLLLDEKKISKEKVKEYIGEIDPGLKMIRFFDEVWRIMKPDCQFVVSTPHAESRGFWQDPSHISGIVPAMFCYFDPLIPDSPLYQIYAPLPWHLIRCIFDVNGNLEAVLEKRRIDSSYKVLSKIPE
jgi:hypothetical protein